MGNFNKERVQNGLNDVYKKIKEIRETPADSEIYKRVKTHLNKLYDGKATEKDIILHLITHQLEQINIQCNIPFMD